MKFNAPTIARQSLGLILCLKKLMIALCAILVMVFHASAKDGITSGTLYSPRDKITPIGDYVSLTAGGKIVYSRLHFKSAKDIRFNERFMVEGQTVLEIHRRDKSVGFIFSSHKDYRVSTSVTDSQIDRISVSSLKDADVYYIWKRDSEGFYSRYERRSSGFPRF